ncbi:MAG TPA: SDR family NAD(P)-dependent oxidoreductase [Bacteroidales bacterium]
MKNILITGGAGFIGSNLSLKLITKGYKVTVLDILSKQIHGENPNESTLYQSIKDKVDFIKGDVSNRQDLEKALKNQDAIIHLAAETGTGQSMYEIEKYNNVNIMGTAIMWDIIANQNHSIKKVVVASSRAIYGEGKYLCKTHGNVYPIARKDQDMRNGDFNVKCPFCASNVELVATTEDSKIHPTSIYGFTKQAQEEMSLIAGKSLNIPVVAFRYQNVYGPGQSLSNPYTGILSIFSTRIKNGNEITVFEDGKESRDFVYIDDVVDATILGLEKDEANFESFNVGTGERIDVLTVAQTLKEKYGASVDVKITGNFRLGDIRHNFADISKAQKLLGFLPKVNFKKGISNFVDWVNTQDIPKDNYQESIEEMKRKGLYK